MKHAAIPLLILLVMAGCSGDAKTALSAAPTSAPAPTVSAETGAIAGVVTNDELLVIEGADVALLDTNLTARTDAQGAFTFNDVTPGAHSLIASKLGYEAGTERVHVLAGETTKVKVLLTPIAVLTPHVESFVDDGYIALAVGAPSVSYQGNPTEPAKTAFKRDAGEGTVSVVATGVWDRSSPATANRMRLSVVVADASAAKEGKGQITARVDELGLKQPLKFDLALAMAFVCLLPGGATDCIDDPPYRLAQVVFQQRTKVYSSVFYVDPAPDGYTGLPT